MSMSNTLRPMDVYSEMREVPFDVAAYCRGHRYSVEAVELAKAIRAAQRAEAVVREAEKSLDQASSNLQDALSRVRLKMERTNGV